MAQAVSTSITRRSVASALRRIRAEKVEFNRKDHQENRVGSPLVRYFGRDSSPGANHKTMISMPATRPTKIAEAMMQLITG
jgi:hypothetical protein